MILNQKGQCRWNTGQTNASPPELGIPVPPTSEDRCEVHVPRSGEHDASHEHELVGQFTAAAADSDSRMEMVTI